MVKFRLYNKRIHFAHHVLYLNRIEQKLCPGTFCSSLICIKKQFTLWL